MKITILILSTIFLLTSCNNDYKYEVKDETGNPISLMDVHITNGTGKGLNLKTDNQGFLNIPKSYVNSKPALFIKLKDGYKFWVKVNDEDKILQKVKEENHNQKTD